VYWRAALVVLAIGGSLAPMPAAIVERQYSEMLYPPMQRGLTGLSNLVPFALVDGLLVSGLAWLAWQIARAPVRWRLDGWRRASFRLLARIATAMAVLYLVFLATWGLNYRRVPLIGRVRFDPQVVSADAARALAVTTVDRINDLYDPAPSRESALGAVDASLADAFAQVQQTLRASRLARPARPKRTLLDVYFKAAGVEGMTDPYFLETLVVSNLLPFERPFVIAHEWSHLAGFADEGEANFVGWLTCVRASRAERYSGWLFLYGQVAAALKDTERTEIAVRLGPGPRADLRAAADRVQRHLSPVIADAGWQVYDRYLKANRVEAGTRSYAEVVKLILGVRFGSGWVPEMK
jgi:Protein of unknown function (DUF3810)